MPAVFVAAWSAEEPTPETKFEPEFAPTMAAMQVPDTGRPPQAPPPEPPFETYDEPFGDTFDEPAPPRQTRIWAVAGIAALIALIVVLVVVVARGGGSDAAGPSVAAPPSTGQPSAGSGPSEATAAPTATGVGGRPRPATIRGADPTGENCEGGFQITGQAGWASQGVRGSPAATCAFVGSVLKAYWDVADPSREPRSVVAAGAIPCGDGSACVGSDFFVTCSAEGSDPWITCRGGRDAVVVLY